MSTLLEKAKGDEVAEFKASKQYTDLLDTNDTMGFEDFRIEAMENFLEVDFSSIKLNLGGATTSSLLQTSLEDINIEDDATTQPVQDDPMLTPLLLDEVFNILFIYVFFFSFPWVRCFGQFKVYLSTFNSSVILGQAIKQLLFFKLYFMGFWMLVVHP